MRTFEYEFQDTGVVVKYRKIPTTLQGDAMRILSSKKPKPTIEELDIAGEKKIIENTDDPDYITKMKVWMAQVNDLYAHLLLDRCVVSIVEPEDWKEEVESYRANLRMWAEMAEVEEYEDDKLSDKLLFIEKLAAGSDDALLEFVNEAQRKSGVTDEAVAEAMATFRPTEPPGRNGASVEGDATVSGEIKGETKPRRVLKQA